jgi:uncharacterized protein
MRARQPPANNGRDRMRSPCVGVCELHGGHCRGCWRTLDEIAGWIQYSPHQRDAIISDLDRRKAAATLAGGTER